MSPPRLPNLIVGGIAVLAAIVAFQSKAQLENEPKSVSATTSVSNPSTEPADAADKEPLTPVYEIFETHARDCTSELPGGARPERSRTQANANPWDTSRLPHDASFRCLIATVPDPVDSRFDYLFDQVVESLQRAVESEGFVVDRAWLPWRQTSGTTAKITRSRLFERQPGLIIFRQSSPDRTGNQSGESRHPRLLLMFLVGETPTAGIHKVALRRALDLVAGCPRLNDHAIRLISPFFSGSHTSLEVVHPFEAAAADHSRRS
jgi:hypothetical protein